MYRHLLPALICCMLLWGCAAPSAAPPESGTVFLPSEAPRVSFYDPGGRLEAHTAGAVRCYPLELPNVTGILPFLDGVVVFCAGEGTTTLILLTGEELYITGEITLDFPISPEDVSVRAGAAALSCYNPILEQTLVLDHALRPVSCIASPDDMTGTPLLSADCGTLYYTTAGGVRAWDLESGIRRSLRQTEQPLLTGLHCQDRVLECTAPDGSALFLSADTGELLARHAGALTLATQDSQYIASFPAGLMDAVVFSHGEAAWALFPEDLTARPWLLPEHHGAVTQSQGGGLAYYDLSSGRLLSRLTVPEPIVTVRAAWDGGVLVLCRQEDGLILYRWDVTHPALSAGDTRTYTTPYPTAEAPDTASLDQCRDRADALGQRYGIQVLLWEEAVETEPWDYCLTAEYLAPVLTWQLDRLEEALAVFPEGMVQATAAHYDRLRVCLVRSLAGTAASGSLDTALGLHFLEDRDAYLVLAADGLLKQTFFHEFYHVMEPHIWAGSILLDQWDKLNPKAFSYYHSFDIPESADTYLSGSGRAFVDRYSMSYATEDRARLMEYAITPGHADVFSTKAMQVKLEQLCRGIREAYGLKKDQGPYPWEQYLEHGL